MGAKTQHVIPYRGKWAVKSERARTVHQVFDRKRDAIDAAHDIARAKGGDVLVHGKNGQPFFESVMKSTIDEQRIRAALRDGTLDNWRSARLKAAERRAKAATTPSREGALGGQPNSKSVKTGRARKRT